MYLVVGATGLLGSEICHQLIAQGKPVRALVRATANPATRDHLQSLGVQFAQGDLKNRASVAAACQGVTAVITTATTTISRQAGDTIQSVDLAGQEALVEAARAAGVPHFIYLSVTGGFDIASPLLAAKRAVEERLMQSGMTYTILRPTYYMESWLGPGVGFDLANAQATIFGTGQQPISWISRKNVAEFAAQALDRSVAHNTIIELGGPEALSPLDVVHICEQISGRTFAVQHISEEVLQSQRESATDPLALTFATLQLQYTKGDRKEMAALLRAFPVRLVTVREYATAILSGN